MPDYKTIILIIGILVLVVILTRKAILKQKQELINPVRPPKLKPMKKGEIDAADEQFEKQWKSLSYLLGSGCTWVTSIRLICQDAAPLPP